jgi:Zn-finger protein
MTNRQLVCSKKALEKTRREDKKIKRKQLGKDEKGYRSEGGKGVEEGKTQELFPYHVNGQECLHVHCLVNSLSQTTKVLSEIKNESLSVHDQDACVLVEAIGEG